MIEFTGVPTRNLIENAFPSIERINKGPIAIIECFQHIPCNPCSTSCIRKAMNPMYDINDLPSLNEEECNGCSICVGKCPGLAIMVVDGSYSNKEVLFKIPFEFLPLPNKGDIVKGLDREGKYITDVKVADVRRPKFFDKTAIIDIVVNREFLYEFRNIRLGD
ncbi:4Fe-4S binding domain-containing protein [Proteiniborus ethanoligenes]|uniref:4Fe-4S binding domain-containing protein n=1 Tax=Proteiniborus ethanoligenes TaxID=415015 RepID=A0A1H3N8L9_9FIRM|nr:4Fe-4S binding protein [Proteiniborus ethanoligenes]SDY85291.1 4Fe-4S binding domain-containing protein [Proteiniborus ethanoligenes]